MWYYINMADLTRFDFHVTRFLYSEDVQLMSAEEVGQYILLICHAWMAGKNASLPNNPSLLAKYARSEKVSPLVMSKWEESDGRLYNRGLSREWKEANTRCLVASENGRLGGLAKSEAKSNAARENGRLGGRPTETQAKPNTTQSISDHIRSTQSYQPNQTRFAGGEYEEGNFKFISTHYRAAFKKDLARTKQNHEEYAAACNTYGEDVVLEKFDEWAEDNQWIASHPKGGNRLFVFLQALPAIIEGDKLAESRKPQETVYQIKDVPDPFEIAPDPDALSPEEILANRDKI
jgi:uncharacterized protein YdaU (DUF1376 family)